MSQMETKHAHYWICESPDGLVCKAVCKTCNAIDYFINVWPYIDKQTENLIMKDVRVNAKFR
jgi:hypothetical protein